MTVGVKRLVHVSSFHAHMQEPLDEPLDESRPLLDPGSYPPYDHSKAEGERIVRAAITKGFDAVIINPSGMLGPHDYKPSHDAGLSWVDISDYAMLNAYEHAKPGAKYILSGHWVTLQYIAQQVARITGTKPPRVVLPMWVAKASAPLATFVDRIRGRRPLFTSISIRELQSNPDISHAKASRELGYEPRPLEQTIADTLDWFRSHGFLS